MSQTPQKATTFDGEPDDGCMCPLHAPDDYDPEDLAAGCSCYYRCARHCKGPDAKCRDCGAAVSWWGDLCEPCIERLQAVHHAWAQKEYA